MIALLEQLLDETDGGEYDARKGVPLARYGAEADSIEKTEKKG